MFNTKLKFFNHPFQIIDKSPWPFIIGISLGFLLFFTVILFTLGPSNFYKILVFKILYKITLLNLLSGVLFWWLDMINESVIEGHYTKYVQLNISIGMILFIISEVMFFFGFFWAFFHCSLSPSEAISAQWPPVTLKTISTWGLPFINTLILISSGVTLTWSHTLYLLKKKYESLIGLGLTLILGFLFLHLQFIEFKYANFTIADSVYGSIFFMITGLHGLHVLVGFLFLTVAFIRLFCNYYNLNGFIGFKLAIWYWHFVDIVWLFVFLFIYWWGNF